MYDARQLSGAAFSMFIYYSVLLKDLLLAIYFTLSMKYWC